MDSSDSTTCGDDVARGTSVYKSNPCLIFDISTSELPQQWIRERGARHRYKHPSVAAWQGFLQDLARQEMSMGAPRDFPLAGPLRYEIEVLYPSEGELKRAPDGKNVIACIEDAFNKLVWVDDGPRYVRAGSWRMAVAERSIDVGTRIKVYALEGQP